MSNTCCTHNNEIMILSCSGGSNVGQLSNQAAVELTQEGVGKMFCLAGIGGRLEKFIQSARDVPEMLVIDGCKAGCAKAVLDKLDIPLRHYLVITDLDIEKNKNFNLIREQIEVVKNAAKKICGSIQLKDFPKPMQS